MGTLRQAGHVVSVVLPCSNNSGMAKAYNFGKVLRPYHYTPPTIDGNDASEPWILVDGTPASCVQLGIYHLFSDRAPVDLVISGPNYGHNLTSVYNLASGTLGGGLEAALCGKRAVSLSFAFGDHLVPGDDGVHSTELIAAASRLSLRLIERLFQDWHAAVEVYHINIPPLSAPWDPPPVFWTTAVRSSLSTASIFQPLETDCRPGAVSDENALQPVRWAPRFTDVKKSLDDAPPGTDAWALKRGFIGLVGTDKRLLHRMLTIESKNHPYASVSTRDSSS